MRMDGYWSDRDLSMPMTYLVVDRKKCLKTSGRSSSMPLHPVHCLVSRLLDIFLVCFQRVLPAKNVAESLSSIRERLLRQSKQLFLCSRQATPFAVLVPSDQLRHFR